MSLAPFAWPFVALVAVIIGWRLVILSWRSFIEIRESGSKNSRLLQASVERFETIEKLVETMRIQLTALENRVPRR